MVKFFGMHGKSNFANSSSSLNYSAFPRTTQHTETAANTITLAAFPLLLFAVWWILSELDLINPYLIPAPKKIALAAINLLQSGELQKHIAVSFLRVFAGYGISVAIALPAALFFCCNPEVEKFFHIAFEVLRAVPPLAMIPLLIIWFGIGEASKLAVIVLATFFPVFLNALNGFISMDKRWLELSKSLELSFTRHLASVLIPAALPQIVTGLRLGFGYSWRALLGAELFASASGLGYLITDSQQMARVDNVFVGIITIGVMGIIFDTLLCLAAKKFSPYSITERKNDWN